MGEVLVMLIAIILNLQGLPAGAATVGCCANMIGFAVASFKENKLGGLLAQGLGTSMLQMANILKRPLIWVPSILTSAILGPVSTCILKMTNTPTGAGMGTSGLVGQFGAYSAMSESFGNLQTILLILAMHVIAPAVLSLIIHLALKKLGIVKDEYLKLENPDKN